jgi:hypothetical protein
LVAFGRVEIAGSCSCTVTAASRKPPEVTSYPEFPLVSTRLNGVIREARSCGGLWQVSRHGWRSKWKRYTYVIETIVMTDPCAQVLTEALNTDRERLLKHDVKCTW